MTTQPHNAATPAQPDAPAILDPGRPGEGRNRRHAARRFLLTERDIDLLTFVAAHRFVLAAHVRAWLGTDRAVAYRRLSALVEQGLLRYERIFHAQPGCYQVTGTGLAMIDSELPRPSIDLRSYRHDTGIVWLGLLACHGRFGTVERLLSEREMRSHDQRPNRDDNEDRYAIPLDGYDRGGKPRVHYPDVLVVDADARRIALELELSVKSRRRLEDILIGYGGEPRITGVHYLTDSRAVAQLISETTATFGLQDRIEVRYFTPPPRTGCQARCSQRWRPIGQGEIKP